MNFIRIGVSMAAAGIVLLAGQRFDRVVRNDFFSGFSGNREVLDRAVFSLSTSLT